MRIGIIGGGIAGLAAAYELEKARAAGEPVEYMLYEASTRLGGSLASEIIDGSVLEFGPDSFLTEKRAAAELCRELGLGAELLPSNDAARKTWIAVNNRLTPLPDGLMFLVPTRLMPMVFTRLFSLRAKIRMGLELLRPPRAAEGDESVAALVERHYGAEAVSRLADPLLRGIYGGDAAQLSACAVLPRLVEMERTHGSFTRGMLAARKKMRAAGKSAARETDRGAEPGREAPAVFTALRCGMQQLVDALAAGLHPPSISTGTAVSAMRRTAQGWRIETSGTGETLGHPKQEAAARESSPKEFHAEEFDGVIVAAPAWAAAALLAPVDDELSENLRAIPYSSSITVNLVYDKAQIGRLPEGFGFLVPASEGRAVMACTFAHRKFLGRNTPGKAVFRAFLDGGQTFPDGSENRPEGMPLLAASDEALARIVRREMSEILGAKTLRAETEPEQSRISRWPRAMAQYTIGHRERIGRIRTRVAALSGLRLAGNAYDGIGISDCIRLGRQAARESIAEAVREGKMKL